jgi:hypothetical protein
LADTAWAILESGFKGHKTYAVIARDLAAAGFAVPERTVARRGQEWRAEQSRREVLAEMGKTGIVLPSWQFEELAGLIGELDCGEGCLLSTRRRILAATEKFLADSSRQSAHDLAGELLRFQLQGMILRRRGLDLGSGRS